MPLCLGVFEQFLRSVTLQNLIQVMTNCAAMHIIEHVTKAFKMAFTIDDIKHATMLAVGYQNLSSEQGEAVMN